MTCTLLFALAGMAVASAWEPLVADLVRRPVPVSSEVPPPSSLPQASAGERAVAEARKYLEHGRPEEAMTALLAVRPEEPVYPYSLQLREEARRALDRVGRRSH